MEDKLKITKTPLRKYPEISKNLGIELWIKHDDEIQRACGGNKVRKLFESAEICINLIGILFEKKNGNTLFAKYERRCYYCRENKRNT